MPEFVAWPKIPRLYRDVIITEKIDGTNAAVGISDDGTEIWAQSRKRIITPEKDNFGFAAFVQENAGQLINALGPGLHFGEWCGKGIQRGYGLDNKWLALFNTQRWASHQLCWRVTTAPVLYEGIFDEEVVKAALTMLRVNGSQFGLGKAEGIVIYHKQANVSFKVTLENDEVPKELANTKT